VSFKAVVVLVPVNIRDKCLKQLAQQKEGKCAPVGNCNDLLCSRKSKYGRCNFVNGKMGTAVFILDEAVGNCFR
jgi:hypothetical protein